MSDEFLTIKIPGQLKKKLLKYCRIKMLSIDEYASNVLEEALSKSSIPADELGSSNGDIFDEMRENIEEDVKDKKKIGGVVKNSEILSEKELDDIWGKKENGKEKKKKKN